MTLTRTQWRWLAGGFGLVTMILLYQYSVVFRGLLAPSVPIALAIGPFVRISRLRARKRTHLIEAARRKLAAFEPDRYIQGAGGFSGLFVDQKRAYIATYTGSGKRVGAFTHRNLLRSEVVEDGGTLTSTARGGRIIGPVGGNVMLGASGIVIGGLSGKRRSQATVQNVTFAVTVNDAHVPVWNIVLLDKRKPILKACREAVRAVRVANDLHALVSALIHKSDDEDKATAGRRATVVRAEATTSTVER